MAKKIYEIVSLEKAFDDVLLEMRQGQGFIPDILNFIDAKKIKAQIIRELKQKIDNGQFKAEDLIKMDVPKGNFFIRPAARPCLQDWGLYQALANYIGLKADKNLGRNVYSSRFDHKTGKLLHWVEQWQKFERAFWVNFDRGFKYVLKTDITAFFSNIGIERLRKCIIAGSDKSEDSGKVIEFLTDNLLRAWVRKERNEGFGLPQGPSASSILANLFLHNVDALLSRNTKIQYLRYADDIRILARTKPQAKVALKTLIGQLWGIGLDLNEKKTQILNPSQAEQLRDPRSKDMDTINNVFNLGDEDFIKKVAMPLLNDLFERSFDSSNTFGDRHLRFSINCFVRLREIYKGKDKDIETIGLKLIDKLESMPGSANTFSRFFSVFPQETFKKQLLQFLKSKDNIYEWQGMWMLDSLLRAHSFSQGELQVFREDIAFNRGKHPLTRSKAILLVGKFGTEPDRYELMTKFNEEVDYLVKRAILIATQQLSVAERNDFYSSVKRTDQEQAVLVDYTKSLKEPVYFDDYVPSPISPIEEQY